MILNVTIVSRHQVINIQLEQEGPKGIIDEIELVLIVINNTYKDIRICQSSLLAAQNDFFSNKVIHDTYFAWQWAYDKIQHPEKWKRVHIMSILGNCTNQEQNSMIFAKPLRWIDMTINPNVIHTGRCLALSNGLKIYRYK